MVLHSKLKIRVFGVKAITFKKGFSALEKVDIINKANNVCSACRLEPCAEVQDAAEEL